MNNTTSSGGSDPHNRTDTGVPRAELERSVDEFLSRGHAPELYFQPIVDLGRVRVVGYELLSRFGRFPTATPDEWFAAATRIGRDDELDALVIERAIAVRDRLPPNHFLSVNISPGGLLAERVRAVLSGASLHRMVFELTEHDAVHDYDLLSRAITDVRRMGGFVAVDDAGAGYSNLQHILQIRPDFVKLDRALIAGLQTDEAKSALVEMFGNFTSRIDTWLIAEGIEDHGELRRLQQLGVPLGQGYLLGMPGTEMGTLDPAFEATLPRVASQFGETVGDLMLAGPTSFEDADCQSLIAIFGEHPECPGIVLLDVRAHPVRIAVRDGACGVLSRIPMTVLDTTDPLEALLRAMTRPLVNRFDPLVCCDNSGVYRGILLIEQLVQRLARN